MLRDEPISEKVRDEESGKGEGEGLVPWSTSMFAG